MAILLWSSLAWLTTLSAPLPPFELTAISFAIATVAGVAKMLIARDNPLRILRQPRIAWILGVGGLFGYHALYFAALRYSPPLEASLVNYLWPLMIVLLSGLLPGERLGLMHLGGAALGLIGTILLVSDGLEGPGGAPLGYFFAFGSTIVWSCYTVASRRYAADVPSDAVTGFCAATALLAAPCHFAFEATVMPTPEQWPVLIALGLGPLGLAFFVWDYGFKHGDIKALGAASYAAPLLSTLLLIATGTGQLTGTVAVSGLLILGGAIVASRGLWKRS